MRLDGGGRFTGKTRPPSALFMAMDALFMAMTALFMAMAALFMAIITVIL